MQLSLRDTTAPPLSHPWWGLYLVICRHRHRHHHHWVNSYLVNMNTSSYSENINYCYNPKLEAATPLSKILSGPPGNFHGQLANNKLQ